MEMSRLLDSIAGVKSRSWRHSPTTSQPCRQDNAKAPCHHRDTAPLLPLRGCLREVVAWARRWLHADHLLPAEIRLQHGRDVDASIGPLVVLDDRDDRPRQREP